MADDGPLRTPALGLDDAHRDARRTRRDDRARRRGVVDVGEQRDLELRALRRVLLYEIGVRDSLTQVRGEAQAIGRGFGRQPDRGRRVPCRLHVRAQGCLRGGGGVGRRHVEASDEIVRRPARTDGAGADDRHAVDGSVHIHGWSLLLGVGRGLWGRQAAGISGRARQGRAFRRTPVRPPARPRWRTARS